MNFQMKKILNNMSALITTLFFISKKIDYKTLSRYMLGIHQAKDLDDLLREVAKCLKDLLNYRLFSFAVQDNGHIDLWIDPSIYTKHMKQVIKNDFDIQGEIKVHYIYDDIGQFHSMTSLSEGDLLSYGLKNENYLAKLYFLQGRRMLPYHNDIINIILETFGTALSNYMNIKRLKKAAAFDPLTNCYNKREFTSHFERHIANAVRYNKELSIVMFDMDHFKRVNDTYGHEAGDVVLKKVSQTILSAIRKGDFLSRYGGEEFILILPETKKTRAIELADRLRKKIEKLDIMIEKKKLLKVTASFGVTALNGKKDRENLLKEVDSLLYKAKASGRNRVMPQLKLCSNSEQTPTSTISAQP